MLLFVNISFNVLVFSNPIDTLFFFSVEKKQYVITGKRKTGYRKEWEKDFNCLAKCKENISKADCTTCKRSFKADDSEFASLELMLVLMVIKTDAGTDGHKGKVKVISGTTFRGVIVTSNKSKIFLVTKA